MNALLMRHIQELRDAGHTIEVTEEAGEQGRNLMVFKDYEIPVQIWSRDKVDLLIIIPPPYPNAKLDMFWVMPKLFLPDGAIPNAAACEEIYLGRTWQRFSWHPSTWNPARDDLKTYLEVVNHRLHQRR